MNGECREKLYVKVHCVSANWTVVRTIFCTCQGKLLSINSSNMKNEQTVMA